MAGHLDKTGVASLLTQHRPGVEMILAPVTPGRRTGAARPRRGTDRELRGLFDFVVVDTPAQFSEHVLTAMDVSAQHVLLTTPDCRR